MNTKTLFLALILILGISLPQHSFSQKKKKEQLTVDIRDLTFRLVGIYNSEWTDYKKKKFSDEYLHYLDSNEAYITVRVEMKSYMYEERKKLTTMFTKPAEFNYEAEDEMKLRISLEPFTLKTDSLLRALVVVKDCPTYIDVTGKITKPFVLDAKINPYEKRKDLHILLTDATAVQSKDKSDDPYYWKKSGKIIPSLSGIVEKKKILEGFDLTNLGFRKMSPR